MEIHLLDWVMAFVVWYLLPKDFKKEMGALAGMIVMGVYCIIFWFFDWIDIFRYLYKIFWLELQW